MSEANELEAIRARHEADQKDTRFERYANQAHTDRATLLRLLDTARAEASAMKDAYSGASEDKFIERKWRQEAEAKLRLNQAASKMLGDDVLEVMDADEATIASLQAELDAAREELRQKGDGWQDISTAPRDGTRVLLAWDGTRVGYYLDNSKTSHPWEGWKVPSMEKWPPGKPTHWQPLPPTRAQGESS